VSDGGPRATPLAVPAEVVRLGDPGPRRDGPDLVAVEAPLAIDLEHGDPAGGAEPAGIRRDRIMTTLRTPGHDAELVVGWLRTEGVIAAAADVVAVTPCETARERGEDVLRVRLRPGIAVDLRRMVRVGTVTAACGACARPVDARAAAGAGDATAPATATATGFPLIALLGAADRMLSEQAGFRHSGGLHAAGLLGRDGRFVVVREDIGRHNAVDKVVGAWLGGRPTDGPGFADLALVVSSRAGYEIVQKAAAVGVGVVGSVGAASSLAVDLAREAGLTLAGFLRENRCSVYAHAGGLRRPDGGDDHTAPRDAGDAGSLMPAGNPTP
jgi:FdhD protein